MKVKISTEEDLRNHIGKSYFFRRLVNYGRVVEIEIDGSMFFRDFKSVVATKFGVEVQYQRFWLFSPYHNSRIFHLNRFLTLKDERLTMEILANQFKFGYIKLFLEKMRGLDPLPPYNVLLFFKLYEPETKLLDRICRYAGMMHVNQIDDSLAGIESELKEMVGFPSHQQINFFKETDGASTCSRKSLHKTKSILYHQLHNGSILWFQKSPMLRVLLYRNPNVPSFLHFRYNLEFVDFRRRHGGGSFTLLVSKEHTYIQVACELAKKIRLADPLKIWLTAGRARCPIEFDSKMKLSHMLTLSTDRKSKKDEKRILYFEERETCFASVNLAKLEIEFRSASVWNKVITHHIILPFESDVHELLEKIIEQEKLLNPVVDLLLFQVSCGQIREVFKACQMISSINFHQHCKLCAQENWREAFVEVTKLSERERELRCGDCAIRVCHFKRMDVERRMEIEYFGDPFLLVIGDDETLAGVKIRIKTKLLVSDEEFSNWMFAHISFGEFQRYLEDEDILLNQFTREHGKEYLGLEHPTSSDEVDPAKSSKMVDPSSSSRKRKRKRRFKSYSLIDLVLQRKRKRHIHS